MHYLNLYKSCGIRTGCRKIKCFPFYWEPEESSLRTENLVHMLPHKLLVCHIKSFLHGIKPGGKNCSIVIPTTLEECSPEVACNELSSRQICILQICASEIAVCESGIAQVHSMEMRHPKGCLFELCVHDNAYLIEVRIGEAPSDKLFTSNVEVATEPGAIYYYGFALT